MFRVARAPSPVSPSSVSHTNGSPNRSNNPRFDICGVTGVGATLDQNLRDQEQFPRRFPAFQIAVRLLRLGQRIRMSNPQLEFSRRDHAEHRP
jgi:hypothetical protein